MTGRKLFLRSALGRGEPTLGIRALEVTHFNRLLWGHILVWNPKLKMRDAVSLLPVTDLLNGSKLML